MNILADRQLYSRTEHIQTGFPTANIIQTCNKYFKCCEVANERYHFHFHFIFSTSLPPSLCSFCWVYWVHWVRVILYFNDLFPIVDCAPRSH